VLGNLRVERKQLVVIREDAADVNEPTAAKATVAGRRKDPLWIAKPTPTMAGAAAVAACGRVQE